MEPYGSRLPGPDRSAAFSGVKAVGIVCLMTLVSVILASCSTPGRTVGETVPLNRTGHDTATHRTMDYRIEFSYAFQPGHGSTSDSIQFNARVIPRRGLNTFVLRLHFLDETGQIIGTSILYAPGARRGAGRPTISRLIEVPDGAARMGFSHEAREQRIRRGRRP